MIMGFWNVRGLNTPLKKAWVVKYIRQYRVALFGFLETKMTATRFEDFMAARLPSWQFILNFDTIKGGRIAIIWDPSRVSCSAVDIGPQFIHCSVSCKVTQKSFLWTLVYGLYSVVNRRHLWEKLSVVGTNCVSPWLIAGDFNAVKSPDERVGGNIPTRYLTCDLGDCCTSLGLTDCPCNREFFTWGNGHFKAKLDRFLTNNAWQNVNWFCQANFLKMDFSSDHCLGLIQILDTSNEGNKPFKFFNMWIKHPMFSSILDTGWTTHVRGTKQFILSSKLKALKIPLKALNKAEFSHIYMRAETANSDFQAAYDALDVCFATEEQHNNVKMLRQKAMFLAEAERLFFCQKLKTSHLISADKGSKYFHDLIKSRNKANYIACIVDEMGNTTISIEQVGAAFVDFFKDLFGQARPRNLCQKEYFQFGPLITPSQAVGLEATISIEEIKRAFFDMSNEKAPGPDGFSAAFFKQNWNIVGPSVIDATLEFFRTGRILKEWNHTIIALIPKSVNAQSVGDYRPISCCNVCYKIIAKILGNQLSGIRPFIINLAQGAFVSGRDMSENIFLAQELIRGYSRKRISLRCMIKVDLRKAYDTIDWDFMLEVLKGLGAPNKFIRWVMECISTPSFSIAINGSLNGFFNGKRGLRQGDPLSPLLFTLCIEYFSRMLSKKASRPGFSFHPNCESLGITHLAFADDLMLFCRGDSRSVANMMEALTEFEGTSGLFVNLHKSNIFTGGVHDNRMDFTGIPKGTFPVKYLGIPLDAQRLKVAHFSPLIEAISHRILDWKGCTLTYAGRLELLNSVIQGVVAFWIQNFPLPSTVIDHVVSMCRKFLWGGKLAPLAWETICLPKDEGGLGIHDFTFWNLAFLSKVVWNIHCKKDSLWVRWIHHVYLKNKDFWSWKPDIKDSNLIKSLVAAARDILSSKLGGSTTCIAELNNWTSSGVFPVHRAYDTIRVRGNAICSWRFFWKGFIPPKF